MRGTIEGISSLLCPTLFSFEQAREDLAIHTQALTVNQIWARPFGFAPAGFHIRHAGQSVDRLITYLRDQPLSAEQLNALWNEMEPGASRDELLAALDEDLKRAEAIIRALDPKCLDEPRAVGRKRLPTTVMGLLVHIAEHTQRHVGQAIAAAKLARQVVPARE
jgi:uncharacterized damage-inducible protein DinB